MHISSYSSLVTVAFLLVMEPVIAAQPLRATIIGGRGPGRCTVTVTVDGAAEVEASGDRGLLTTLSGQNADWRRFQCTGPIPHHPREFSLVGLEGRGTLQLVRDPSRGGGRAVVRIDDPRGGRGLYSFDLQWRESKGWGPPPPPRPQLPTPQLPVPGRGPGGMPSARVLQACQDSVTDRLYSDGYRYVAFDRAAPDNNPGPGDWVTGWVSGRRGPGTRQFSFSCSVDFRSGSVRSVDLRERR
jgi:hypothetical protein